MTSPLLPFPASPRLISACAETSVSGLRLASYAEGEPFAALRENTDFQPDNWKAFIEYRVCHALPTATLGPADIGDMLGYFGFFGDTLSQSYRSLIFQQFNYRHLLKEYAAKDKKAGKRDRIIGMTVAVAMPPRPVEGWYSPKNPNGAKTAVISGLASVSKLADGMDEILGDHLTSREEQSVSIEVAALPGNLGVWLPGSDQMFCLAGGANRFANMPEAWAGAFTRETDKRGQKTGPTIVGQVDGKQLVLVYGAAGQPVEFRGVGMTPEPAEKFTGTNQPAARIVAVNAEQSRGDTVTRGQGDKVNGEVTQSPHHRVTEPLLYCAAAECAPQFLRGTRMCFENGAVGVIQRVRTEGYCAGHRASSKDPLVDFFVGGRTVELSASAVRRRLRHV